MQRLVIFDGMAKSNKDIFKEASKPVHFFHLLKQSEFKEIVRENLKAQEASLNAMKLLAKAIFGSPL